MKEGLMKVVIAMDSYKGCLASEEVEAAAAQGVRDVFPEAVVEGVPLSDGGEGLMEVLVQPTQGRTVPVTVHDPLMRPVGAAYGVLGDGRTAVVEMAQASGLPLLGEAERNPMLTTTYGTGELMREVLDAGYRHLLLGIGGSATNDGGMGMMQALGARFLDAGGRELPTGCGALLPAIAAVDTAEMDARMAGVQVEVACDVSNPFCGENGAARIFAPQKGASPAMVAELEAGMSHFAQIVRRATDVELRTLAGAGAAGGLGGGLHAFFGAPLLPGIDLVLTQLGFPEKMKGADLVITGEGRADRQTLMGKVPMGVLRRAREEGVPVALFAGAVADGERLLEAGFASVVAVTPAHQPLAEALVPDVARGNVRRAVGAFLEKNGWLR